ncbi:HET domain-containing protein [Fusarium keratoplasticum]|nr:HET domain-containing protein [Fusarium keratoplasticum]
MRLLNTQTIVVETFGDDQIPPYAILSHTWEAEEVTFQDMELGKATGKKGWAKVKGSCSMARKNGFDYVWLDTCCIDKTSSAELSEAINSMYRWYQEATVCYAFLADVSDLAELPKSKWFTRGWTLQELIAPSSMIFFSQTWDELGTKETLDRVILKRTRIPEAILSGYQDLETASVAQRMSWASDRRTTRREDLAYCLMGIFGINMPLLYGEGERAFVRLQEEIMRVSDDHSLFAWKCPNSRGGLLALSPAAFKDSGSIIPWNPFTPYNSPFTLTNKGVHLDLPFIGLGDRGTGLAVLSCTEVGDPDKLVAIYLRDTFLTMEHFERCKSEKFELVSLSKFRPAEYPTRSLCITLRGPNQRLKGTSDGKAHTGPSPLSDERLHIGRGDKGAETEEDEHRQLSLAAARGRQAEVNRLLALPNVHADGDDYWGDTPLCLAAEAGYEGIVRLLLDHRDIDVNSEGNTSPIKSAIAGGHEGVVWQLLARTDTISNPNELVSMAAGYGHEALFSQLTARKDIREHLTSESYASGLTYAAQEGHESIVRLLLNSGKVHPDEGDGLGNTALWWAAVNGNEAVVKMLLETGWVDTSCKGNDETTALWHAALKGYEGIVRLLLQHGADIEAPGRDGRSPLCVASSKGHASIVKDLLFHGAETNPRGRDNRTALMEAAINGHEAIVRLLLESGAAVDTKVRTESMSRTHYSAVDFACQADHGGIPKLLLEANSPFASRDADIRAALHDAVEHGCSDVVRTLLETTDVKQSILQPFHLVVAAINKDQAMAKVLLENGADVNSEWNGSLLFGFAVKQGCDEVVKAMLPGDREQGWKADVERRAESLGLGYNVGRNESDIPTHTIPDRRRVNWYMLSPLWCAAVNGHKEMVQLLLEHGANPNNVVHTSGGPGQMYESSTALSEATRLGYEGIVRLLLSSGANPDPSTLIQASLNATHRSVAIAQMLLEAGADVDAMSDQLETPLMFAARSGNVDLVKLLITHGADRNAENRMGKTTMRYASNHAITNLLL